jgi:hypothetical protein
MGYSRVVVPGKLDDCQIADGKWRIADGKYKWQMAD